jgi:hypothetical protein
VIFSENLIFNKLRNSVPNIVHYKHLCSCNKGRRKVTKQSSMGYKNKYVNKCETEVENNSLIGNMKAPNLAM